MNAAKPGYSEHIGSKGTICPQHAKQPLHAKHKAHQQFQWHYAGGHSMHSTRHNSASYKNIRYYIPVVHTAAETQTVTKCVNINAGKSPARLQAAMLARLGLPMLSEFHGRMCTCRQLQLHQPAPYGSPSTTCTPRVPAAWYCRSALSAAASAMSCRR